MSFYEEWNYAVRGTKLKETLNSEYQAFVALRFVAYYCGDYSNEYGSAFKYQDIDQFSIQYQSDS